MTPRVLLELLVGWAQERSDVRAVVVTGSLARGEDDAWSDLDVELYLAAGSPLPGETGWYARFGDVLVVEELANPGWVPTRLVYLAGGGKLDVALVPATDAATFAHPHAFEVVLDKDGIADLLSPPEPTPPVDASDLRALRAETWAALLMAARGCARGDLWTAQARLWDARRFAVEALQSQAADDGVVRIGGRGQDRWLDPVLRDLLGRTFVAHTTWDLAAAVRTGSRLADRAFATIADASWQERRDALVAEVERVLAHASRPTGSGDGIEEVRREIDALDRQVVHLIAERQGWVVRAGRLKADRDAVRAPDRVAAVIAKVRALASDAGADPDVVERTYRAMIGAFIDLELSVHDRDQAR